MTLIDRLRTGTHEQSVGLLLEVQEAVKPQPSMDSAVRAALNSWFSWKAAFDAILRIGTPEACVGAAMMLMPETVISVSFDWPPGIEGATCGAILTLVALDGTTGMQAVANTPALALAAAIMETRNV